MRRADSLFDIIQILRLACTPVAAAAITADFAGSGGSLDDVAKLVEPSESRPT
jgi:hypothetical protein